MKNKIKIWIFVLSFLGVVDGVYAQTFMEEAVNKINVNLNLPSFFEVSPNEDFIYVTEYTKGKPIPSFQESYQADSLFILHPLNRILGMVHAVMEHKTKEYVVFVYVSPGRTGSTYGKIGTDEGFQYVAKNLAFGRIKNNFRGGGQSKDASEPEAIELYKKLTNYPREQAKGMFNANVMVSYPVDIKETVYWGKYSKCRALAIAKDRLVIYCYFMMTDKGERGFDEYIKDLNNVFWFNE